MTESGWVWIPWIDQQWLLAYRYHDPISGPMARGSVVTAPLDHAQMALAIEHPDQVARLPEVLGARPISPDDALDMGFPYKPRWLEQFEQQDPYSLAGARIVGQVVQGGRPVPDAIVSLVWQSDPTAVFEQRFTDLHGRFGFRTAHPEQHLLQATAASGGSLLRSMTGPGPISLALFPCGTLVGQVFRAGFGVAAAVKLISLEKAPSRLASANASGAYLLRRVVAGRYRVAVTAHDKGHMPNGLPTVSEIEVLPNLVTQHNFSLRTGVTVTVVVKLNGERFAGHVKVCLLPPEASPARHDKLRPWLGDPRTRTGNSYRTVPEVEQSNTFEDVTPGEYTLAIMRSYNSRTYDHEVVGCQRVTLLQATQTLEVTLPPRS